MSVPYKNWLYKEDTLIINIKIIKDILIAPFILNTKIYTLDGLIETKVVLY